MNNVEWDYFDKFEGILDEYMPDRGEGETKASQAVTAINKLIYKWYNDGDVFDNTFYLKGWCNNLSSYANWLHKHGDVKIKSILERIKDAYDDDDYENILKDLADTVLNEEFLCSVFNGDKIDSIYKCEGQFKFTE